MKKKVIEFIKNQWQKILLFFAAILFIVIGLCSKNCRSGLVLKANYQTSTDLNQSYYLFNYDILSFNGTSNDLYSCYSIPLPNSYFFNIGEFSQLTEFASEFVLGAFLNNGLSWDISALTNYSVLESINILSDIIYLPSNVSDYYIDVDKIQISSEFVSLNLDVLISYDLLDIATGVITHITEDNTYFIPINEIVYIDLFGSGGLDITGLNSEDGSIITNYVCKINGLQDIGQTQFNVGFVFGITELLDEPFIFMQEQCSVCPELPTSIDVGSFLSSSIGAFMDFELFPGFSISGLLATILSVGLFILFLKVFAGG